MANTLPLYIPFLFLGNSSNDTAVEMKVIVMNRKRFMKRMILVLLVVSFVTTNNQVVNANNEGEQALDFTLETSKEQLIKLKSFKGKTLVLNFWTTWCTYCQEEITELNKFYSEKGEDIELMGVNITSSEQSKQAVVQFIENAQIKFLIGMDINGDVSKKYGIIGIPTTFIIDKSGVIKKKIVGPVNATMLHHATSQM